MSKKHPALHTIYRLFFRGEEVLLEVLLKFFDQKEIDTLIQNGIIACTNSKCISNYRFVPVDDLLIVGSPKAKLDDPDYIYIGEDSVVFYNLLKEELTEKVIDALEIGCGTGFLSVWMSMFTQNVTAVDISPGALKFAKLNAKINGVKNIVIKNSDVFSNIHGKFDLIISNPPYVFLPDENIGRTFAYGGKLGIEILEKILHGLDEHLKDTGTCYMIFFSYIKEDGTNTAYEMIKKVFYEKPFSIILKQIDYYPIKHYPSFYKQQGISHTIRYLIKIQKSSSYKFEHIQIQGINKIIQKVKIKF